MLASSTAAVEKEQSTVAEVGEIAEHPADTPSRKVHTWRNRHPKSLQNNRTAQSKYQYHQDPKFVDTSTRRGSRTQYNHQLHD